MKQSSKTLTTKEVSKEQIWALFKDVDNWNKWDENIEYSKIEGKFKEGNFFLLKPKGAPTFKIKIHKLIINKLFIDITTLPLAKMYGKHEFEETENGLKITTTMSMKGFLSCLWWNVIAKGIIKNMESDINKQIEYAKNNY